MAESRWNLPNTITLARILACPVIAGLAIAPGTSARLGAFVLFLAAAVSDLWDGYLARKHGLITNFGKLADPIADKLLLVATFVPFYLISHRSGDAGEIPWWGELPLWVVVVIFGRELFITLFRFWVRRRGVVISAGASGKYKAFLQNLFSGSLLLWYPLAQHARAVGWGGGFWDLWAGFHGAFVGTTLLLALVLTVYSLGDYLWAYRALMRGPA